jgi:hypothetical protein
VRRARSQVKDLKRAKSQEKLEAALRRREEQLKKIQDRMRKHMEKVPVRAIAPSPPLTCATRFSG